MKTRVLTGFVAGVGAILALLFLPTIGIRIALMLLCVIGMYELLSALGLKFQKPMVVVTSLFAMAAPFLDMFRDVRPALAVALVYMLLLTFIQLKYNQTLKMENVMYVIGGSAMIIMPIASLAILCATEHHGRAYIFLALIIAWVADMGAYFAGTLFGKHKLCPNVSPKKTVEGLIGGMVCSVLFSLLGAWIYQMVSLGDMGLTVVYWQVAIVSLVMSPLTVVGDLICSVIKRQKGIKDYGKLFPGHGGVLDRFDSLIFITPALCIITSYLPMIAVK